MPADFGIPHLFAYLIATIHALGVLAAIHAVLTVRTAQGDFVLDNLDDDVKLWTKTSYRFLKRQASFNTGRWVTIENGAEIVVGSVGR